MTTCDRCGRETVGRTMSWFNEQMICTGDGSCGEAEHAHPDPALAAVACHRVVFGALDQDLAFGGPDPVGPVLSAGDLQQSLMHAVLGILGTAP